MSSTSSVRLLNSYRKPSSTYLQNVFSTHGFPIAQKCRAITSADNLSDILAPSTAFLTVSLTGTSSKKPAPGDTDPSIPLTIADAVREAWSNTLSTNPMRQILAKRSQYYVAQSMRMRTGGTVPWWSSAANPWKEDEMTYECDASLGRPKDVDCAQVEWGELGADTDVVELVPGVMKTLSSSRFAGGPSRAGLTVGM